MWRPATSDYGASVPTVTNSNALLVSETLASLPNGVIVVVKKDCATCEMVAPVLGSLGQKQLLAVVVGAVVGEIEVMCGWSY